MSLSRRYFLQLTTACLLAPVKVSARVTTTPALTTGCASGEVSAEGAIIWTRADSPSRLWVDVDSSESFSSAMRFRGSAGIKENDFNTHCLINGLRPGQRWFYRAQCESLEHPGVFSNSLTGQFKTAPVDRAPIRFCWSGDTAGQGYGIDPDRGGMRTYQTMLRHRPDFFVHSGDHIYADSPVQATLSLDDGSVWKNLVTAGKDHVAQTVQDFRENYYYNYLDTHYRQFHANVPLYQQWDDHDVHNDWYPGEVLGDDRYQTKSASLLAVRSRQALFDCNPIRKAGSTSEQIYRQISYGPMLDLFFLDLRSYRGANSSNQQTHRAHDTDYMGMTQLEWLKTSLSKSTATWKIICSDMPLGLVVKKWGTDLAENPANSSGPPAGREFELAELFAFIKANKIRNVHFITADVHYCGSYYYNPEVADFKNFSPFWEFVSGPIHAGTFGPNKLDNTFGPKQKFIGIPENMKPNRPPSDGYQFFGQIDIDPNSQALTVSHYNVGDELLWQKSLLPDS